MRKSPVSKLSSNSWKFERVFKALTDRKLWSLGFAALLCCIAMVFVSANIDKSVPAISEIKSVKTSKPGQQRPNAATIDPRQYVQRWRLQPQLREALRQLGDRLERPGKERLTLLGTLTRLSGSQVETAPFRLITEFQNRMRLEEQVGTQLRVTVFNGSNAAKLGGPVNRRDEDLIETLVFDSVDNYLIKQTQGAATRFLGSRFRLDNGEAENYSGSYYDLYQTTDQIRIGPSIREQSKQYYFNSDTQLLEHVRYEIQPEGARVSVEVQITGWRKVLDHNFSRYQRERK